MIKERILGAHINRLRDSNRNQTNSLALIYQNTCHQLGPSVISQNDAKMTRSWAELCISVLERGNGKVNFIRYRQLVMNIQRGRGKKN